MSQRPDDDDFEFPPTAHPGREVFTFALAVLVVLFLLVWGGWTLFSWLILR
jgi:hypothetical protein